MAGLIQLSKDVCLRSLITPLCEGGLIGGARIIIPAKVGDSGSVPNQLLARIWDRSLSLFVASGILW